jgi:hypothetical protein
VVPSGLQRIFYAERDFTCLPILHARVLRLLYQTSRKQTKQTTNMEDETILFPPPAICGLF